MHSFITGIQQIGIGVKNLQHGKFLYRDLFGLDVLIFDDTSDAHLMTKYTGSKIYNRRAMLVMNLAGGGGFEIWQYNNRDAKESVQRIKYGDIGIFAAKIKCRNIAKAHAFFSTKNCITVSAVQQDPARQPHFWVKDEIGNCFNVIAGHDWFKKCNKATGAVSGAVIGVTDMEKALPFYKIFLGIDEVVYDVENRFLDNDLAKNIQCRRVLLRNKITGKGAFNKLLGTVEIELVQNLAGNAVKIFEDRYWGDCGFIHLCFDVMNMDGLKSHAAAMGINFTVDSKDSFEMNNASGRFCYAEDPDGTLIEFVETHKIHLLKKLGIYLNLKNRKVEKPLPDWMINLLSLSKVK